MTHRCYFDSLEELIQYYSHDADALYCKLTVVCPRVDAPTTDTLLLNAKEEWEIEQSSIREKTYLRPVCRVWDGVWKGTTPVAVKTLKPGTITAEDFLVEAQIMRKLQHKKLIQLYGICTTGPMYIVTEFMKKENLLEYIRVHLYSVVRDGRTIEHVRTYVRACALALTRAHQTGR